MLIRFPVFYIASFTLLLGLVVYYGITVVLPPANRPLNAGWVQAVLKETKGEGHALPLSILVDIYQN